MKAKFTKEELKEILKRYYNELEGREVKIKINSKRECVGLYENYGCVTTIKAISELNIGGIKKEIEETISNKRLNEIITAVFDKDGYTVKNVELDDGLNSRWEGYGMMEHQVQTVYCKGIEVIFEQKQDYTLKRV